VVAVAGVLLALAGLRGPWSGVEAGGPAALVTVRLPGALRAAIVALSALAALLLLALMLPMNIRRKRKNDEEFQLYHEPPKLSPWMFVLLAGLVVAPLGLLASLFWADWAPGPPAVGTAQPDGHAPPPAGQPASPSVPGRPAASLRGYSAALGGLALFAALASVALLLWFFLGDRLAWWGAGPSAAAPAVAPLREAVEGSLEELRREPDARRAIILCYRRFEQALAGSGFPRAPWETPMEFMRQTLGRLALPPAAVATLTRLFELSRFSHHGLGPAERDRAIDSLLEIQTVLTEVGSSAPAA